MKKSVDIKVFAKLKLFSIVKVRKVQAAVRFAGVANAIDVMGPPPDQGLLRR